MKLLSTLALLLTITTLYAQPNLGTWQWARQAGGVFNTGSNENEQVNDMCTDKYGNIYTVGSVYKNPYFNGQQFFAPFASFGSEDGFVAKYDNCGNLKWVRFMGTPSQDQSNEVAVDDSLNVYIIGFLGTNNAVFPDSTHTDTVSNAGLFWAKYDYSGDVKWIKTPTSRTAGLNIYPNTNLVVRPNGNLWGLIVVDTGLFYSGFSYVGTQGGNAIFEFDHNGNPVSLIRIDSSSSQYINSALSNVSYGNNGNIVFTYGMLDTTQIFDSVFYTPTNVLRAFVIKANYNTQKIQWVDEFKEGINQYSGINNVVFDNLENIIAIGSGEPNSVFAGDTINYNSGALNEPVLFKLDSSGHKIWGKIADGTSTASSATYYPSTDGVSIKVPMQIYGTLFFGSDTINTNGSPIIDLISVLSSNGDITYSDSVVGSFNEGNIGNIINCSTQDQQGNVYIGGGFAANLIAGSSINNIGGINDAFILKWGLPCTDDTNALSPPLAAIDLVAYASSLHSIDVSWQNVSQYAQRYRVYRSTTDSSTGYSVIDSVSNSTTQYTDTNVVTNQIYWYRVSAVNGAGETFSNSDSAIIIPTGISTIPASGTISLYPNPNSGSFILQSNGSIGREYTVFDMIGRAVAQGPITADKQSISLKGIVMGSYTLEVHGSKAIRFVIEN